MRRERSTTSELIFSPTRTENTTRSKTARWASLAILGISKPVIKAHGSSDANAIKNAVRQAIHFVDTKINDDITAFAVDYDEKKMLADAERMYTSEI